MVLGAGQSAVGSYLVGLWGFAQPIVEAICFQSALEHYPVSSFSPALAVHVANVLYYRQRPEEILGRRLELNMPVLEAQGLQDRLPAWEDICDKVLQTEAEESE